MEQDKKTYYVKKIDRQKRQTNKQIQRDRQVGGQII